MGLQPNAHAYCDAEGIERAALRAKIERLEGAIRAHEDAKTRPGCGHAFYNADQRLWDTIKEKVTN